MKLSMILSIVAIVQTSASVLSQNLTINVKETNMREVLRNIETQSNYRFFYNDQLSGLNNYVTLNVKKKSLNEILDKLLANKGLTYKMLENNMVVITPEKFAQVNRVSGIVTDKTSGEPLTGVNIVIKGTTRGTVTDSKGEYSIDLQGSETALIFSYMGYQAQEISIKGKRQINVILEVNTSKLNEVVVIGYGSVKKQDLTSSVSKINDKAIESRPISNLSEAFAGQLAGVRAQNTSGVPGSELQIRIRGVNTINGSSDPLYVVDGVPKDNISDINPTDIANIQILKDASATSIYGSRGANGVVLIETKQGTGKPSFTFDSYYGWQQGEKKMDMMNKNEWLAYQIWYRNVSWLRQGHSMKDPMASRPANLQIPESWLDPTLKGTDWQDAIFQTAPMKSYQLSGSAKSDIGSIYVSGGYLDQDGIVYNTYYKRTNFRFNGTLNVNKRIKIGLNIAPSYSDKDARASEGKENVIHHAITQSPLIQLNQATRDWGFPVGMGQVYPNPLEQLKETKDNLKKTSVSNTMWGQWEIIKGLIFKSQFGLDFTNNTYEYFMPGNVTYNNGNMTVGNSYSSNNKDFTLQNTLVYEKNIGNHFFNLLAGQSAEDHTSYRITAVASGWPSETIETLNVAKTPTTATTYKDRNTELSYFGRASYSFKDRYLLNASIRYDGSSRFGKNNKWGLFPSISAGWKINEEAFLREVNWITLLKIRGAWGMAGNNRIGNYDYMAKLALDNTSWAGNIVTGVAPSNIANDDLKWEATATTDLGLDFTGFSNRIQLNLDYYKNTTSDLLFNVPIPNTTGFSSLRTNLGTIRNEGWEIDLTTVNTSNVINWTTTFNLSKEKNKVIDMGGLQQFTSVNWDAYFITKVGGPVSQFLSYKTNGLLTNDDFDENKKALVPIFAGQEVGNLKYVDVNGDNKITTDDMVPMGTNIPDFTYGITNIISCKNLELSVLIQGQAGGKVLFLSQRQLDFGGTNINTMRRWLHQWKPDYEAIYGTGENPIPTDLGVDMSWDGKTPNTFGKRGDNNDDTRIYSASFVRIKNVTLSYKMPHSLINKTFFNSVRFYASIDNLKTFTNYPGYNPETNTAGNSTTQLGVDYATYPLSKRFTIGVNLTF